MSSATEQFDFDISLNPLSCPGILTLGVEPHLSIKAILDIDRLQQVRKLQEKMYQYKSVQATTFSHVPIFGRNDLANALVTPEDDLNRTIFGFMESDLTREPSVIAGYLGNRLFKAFGGRIAVEGELLDPAVNNLIYNKSE